MAATQETNTDTLHHLLTLYLSKNCYQLISFLKSLIGIQSPFHSSANHFLTCLQIHALVCLLYCIEYSALEF